MRSDNRARNEVDGRVPPGLKGGWPRLMPEPRLHLWESEKLAAVAIDVGLFSWLSERTR